MLEYNVDEKDRRIMQFRALGFKQEEIATQLGISQATVSQRLEEINKKARESSDPEKFFWGILLGAALVAIGVMLAKKVE